MDNHNRNMMRVLRANPELRQQLINLRNLGRAGKRVLGYITRILTLRLPFLAHPSYHLHG
ncbi:hypothetical protein [Amphritea sp.]|uniref:hypothetical protein n=1 Tax=Amphritea sp. TaxID=1872502 RepID=UPI003A8F2D0E